MRYTEQIKYSWRYHWGIFREIWDMFTLRKWYWLVVGLFVVFCIVPDSEPLVQVLGVASVGLLLVACLRESRAMDREE